MMPYLKFRYTAVTFLFVHIGLSIVYGNTTLPSRFGMVLYPGFTSLDVFGPLESLWNLSQMFNLNLSLIAPSLDPVPNGLLKQFSPAQGKPSDFSNFHESIVPTHTFETAPDLDVLIVPGGPGALPVPLASTPALSSAIEFVKSRYPTLQYLITVCNGAGIAASAGVLDGKNATTNKSVFNETAALGPKTNWIAKARWVTDGNIWTAGGVSAGIDVAIAFISTIYGDDLATMIAKEMEYERHANSTQEPFSSLYNIRNIAPLAK